MRVIGLMSGTSADAVDAALVEWPAGEAPRPFRLLAAREDPNPPELQERIHRLAAGRVAGDAALAELARLDVALGEWTTVRLGFHTEAIEQLELRVWTANNARVGVDVIELRRVE